MEYHAFQLLLSSKTNKEGFTKMSEVEWTNIKGSRPADLIFGKCGAFKYRTTNSGGLEIWCRNGFDKTEHLVKLAASCQEGFDRWLSGDVIQNALPYINAQTRETLINGMIE